jgi:hypothetical protein
MVWPAEGQKLSDQLVQDVKEQILVPLSKSLSSPGFLKRSSQLHYITCHTAANKAKLRPYHILVGSEVASGRQGKICAFLCLV